MKKGEMLSSGRCGLLTCRLKLEGKADVNWASTSRWDWSSMTVRRSQHWE